MGAPWHGSPASGHSYFFSVLVSALKRPNSVCLSAVFSHPRGCLRVWSRTGVQLRTPAYLTPMGNQWLLKTPLELVQHQIFCSAGLGKANSR